LSSEDGDLVMREAESGARLLTEAEAEHERAEAERTAREAAEAEVQKRREKLRQRGLSD
jgi:hypothetical protein